SYNASTFTITITPTSPLAVNTTYTATVSGVKDTAGNAMASPVSWSFTTANTDTVWVDDTLPAGAVAAASGGDAWTWVSSNPPPFSASLASQSALAAGVHQHYFFGATDRLSVGASDHLYAYVFLDPAHPPSEVMLQWHDATGWEHRAYWGANL